MATFSSVIPQKSFFARLILPVQIAFRVSWHPNRKLLLSFGLLLLGLCIPCLMVLGYLPVNLFVCLLGFLCSASGGTIGLIFRGELM